MIGAFFMATDYVTSPLTKKGRVIFGLGCGLLTMLIRRYGGYPEGVCYAILIMNAVVPLLDRGTMPQAFRGGEGPCVTNSFVWPRPDADQRPGFGRLGAGRFVHRAAHRGGQEAALQQALSQALPGATEFDRGQAIPGGGAKGGKDLRRLRPSIVPPTADGSPAGAVVTVAPAGYGGPITTMVGIGGRRRGQGRAGTQPDRDTGPGDQGDQGRFLKAFNGARSGENLAVNKDGGRIAAVTGATISSRAVTRAVNRVGPGQAGRAVGGVAVKFFRALMNGIVTENPTFRLVLGTCPTMAITLAVTSGIGMGVAATAVLIGSNVIVSLIRKVIPDEIRIPCFIVVIAAFVTIVDKMMNAFTPGLHQVLGIFIPLIVVNCIIIARAEAYAYKNSVGSPWPTGWDGIGFTMAITLISVIREILGNGTFLLPGSPFPIRATRSRPRS